MFIRTLAGALALAALSSAAVAGPADDARAHFSAIGAGQVDALMGQYAPDAHFQWVGGPLNGAYAGSDSIKEVWAKFGKNGPFEVSVGRLEESANDKGATVTANVEFKGKAVIKVRYVLVYRDGKLVNEVWQIDPKLSLAGY
jgi:opacity protein-like surface antigen